MSSDQSIDKLADLEGRLYIPSPLQELAYWNHNSIDQVKYYIKRDDLIDPYISGNKYRKLKGQLITYLENQEVYRSGILSYGGAYSNHLYATAAACHRLSIPLTAIVRGEEVDLDNLTLSYLTRTQTTIYRISRSDYRLKSGAPLVNDLLAHGHYLEVPEGGNAIEAQIGVQELCDEIYSAITPDYICIAAGTGTTARYLLESLNGKRTKLIICSAVRDQSVKADILALDHRNQVEWIEERWGGFARKKPDLISSMTGLVDTLQIPLEYVYTGKLLTEVNRLRSENYFSVGSTVVVIHTGGLRPSNQVLTTLG